MDRGQRLEALIAFLRANRSATMAELAHELDISVRTVRRDIASLRLRGMDIEGERGRGGGVRFSRFAPRQPVWKFYILAGMMAKLTGLEFLRRMRHAYRHRHVLRRVALGMKTRRAQTMMGDQGTLGHAPTAR